MCKSIENLETSAKDKLMSTMSSDISDADVDRLQASLRAQQEQDILCYLAIQHESRL